ncbi:MAG TPA: hypothetical protein DCE26_08500 [Dehalococcoidia bacterium]|nr:hypothetical protein [Dehalococcoidia bacterium]HCP22541.1 hypothetical protein [Dehalococcoidia bacterium]
MEGGGHSAVRHLVGKGIGKDHFIERIEEILTDEGWPHGLAPLGFGALGKAVAQHCGGAFQLVAGQVLGAAVHGLVTGGVQDARDVQDLLDVLGVVPFVELFFPVRWHVAPDHEQPSPFLGGHIFLPISGGVLLR